MTTIDRYARAIAEVREKYFIGYEYYSDRPRQVFRHPDHHHDVPKPLFTGTEDECQAWIDREAARACLLATLPGSNAVLRAMGTTCLHDDERGPDNIELSAQLPVGLEKRFLSRIFTAAITAITKEG